MVSPRSKSQLNNNLLWWPLGLLKRSLTLCRQLLCMICLLFPLDLFGKLDPVYSTVWQSFDNTTLCYHVTTPKPTTATKLPTPTAPSTPRPIKLPTPTAPSTPRPITTAHTQSTPTVAVAAGSKDNCVVKKTPFFFLSRASDVHSTVILRLCLAVWPTTANTVTDFITP